MDSATALATLQALGVTDPENAISTIEDGSTTLLHGSSGSNIALLRRANRFDTLVLGAQPDCPVPSLRAMLETAVLPLSETYADTIGIAAPERDAFRRRIREASVALDVLAKGRLFSVPPPDLPLNASIRRFVADGASSADEVPDETATDPLLLNQMQANVVSWSREIDRLVQMTHKGPDAILSAEAETVFWSSLDAALSTVQATLSTKTVKITLELLARKRRATGFSIDAANSLDSARRKAAGVLTLIQGLPIVAVRTADDLPSLRSNVDSLLDHIAAKLRISSFSIERVLSLVDSMGSEVKHSMSRILSQQRGGILMLSFDEFESLFEACYELFESWSQGFDHCRKVARDAARKKGESLPPRRKSPLSTLHAHLTDIYELRADNHALRSTLLELSSKIPGSTKRIQQLDKAYALVVETGNVLNHFNLSQDGEARWAEIRGSYELQVRPIEASTSSDYSEFVKEGRDLQGLSQLLTPFRRLLDKQFMTIATGDAVPKALALGKSELRVLRRRQIAVHTGSDSHTDISIPIICKKVCECRQLQARATAIEQNIRHVLGMTHLDVNPDVRDFLSDVEQLYQKIDPVDVFSSWLNCIDRKAFLRSQSLLSVVEDCDEEYLALNIDDSAANFFKVFQIVRDDRDLQVLFSSTYLELYRTSKAIFPAYSNLKESLSCYNRACEILNGLDPSKFRRIFRFVEEELMKSEDILASAAGMQWDNPLGKLISFSGKVLAACYNLNNLLHAVLEHDSTIENAVQELNSLTPELLHGRLSEESKKELETAIKRFCAGASCFKKQFGDSMTRSYIRKYWSDRLLSSLYEVFQKLSAEWVRSLKSGTAFQPVEILRDEKKKQGGHLLCLPPICDVELALYEQLGRMYDIFGQLVDESSVGELISETETPSSHGFISGFLLQWASSLEGTEIVSCFSAVHYATSSLSLKLEEWGNFYRYVEAPLKSQLDECDVDTQISVLEELTSSYESIVALRMACTFDSQQTQWLTVNVESISEQILSVVRERLGLYSSQISSKAASKSQDLYRKLSETQASVTDIGDKDVTETLLILQTVREDIIPSCTTSLDELSRLEEKFDDIAERNGDASLSYARNCETWVLSEGLWAQLQTLNDLQGQRYQSVLLNRDILIRRHHEKRQKHQQTLTSLFDDFRFLRNNDHEDADAASTDEMLNSLEKELKQLEIEGRQLGKVARALDIGESSGNGGVGEILSELKKVRTGLHQLSSLSKHVSRLSNTKFREFDSVVVREELEKLSQEAENIGMYSGAKSKAKTLHDTIHGYLQVSTMISKLRSIKMSPPRERDILHRLFGESYSSGGIDEISLKAFWEANLLNHETYLRAVFENAAGEASIADFLESIAQRWYVRSCSFQRLGETFILQGIPGLVDELEEHLQGLATMAGSPHSRLFESDRAAWEQRLASCRDRLELLTIVQARWADLRILFGSGPGGGVSGLRRELHEEFAAFSNVHARFTAFGDKLESSHGILEGLEGSLGLEDMVSELKGIVRGLSKFLERQRTQFPRFFFLSDNDLLHVLSVSPANLESLNAHIGKLFPGVQRFHFEVDGDGSSARIISVLSKETECLKFERPVHIDRKQKVTAWLLILQERIVDMMQMALPSVLKIFATSYYSEHTLCDENVLMKCLEFPAQVVLMALKISFTKAFEKGCVAASGVTRPFEILLRKVNNFLTSLRSSRIDQEQLDGAEIRFWILRDQMIKECIYQKDVITTAIGEGVKSSSSHVWHHQLRLYEVCDASNRYSVTIRCASAEFQYGWEYLGMGETLVHTSLTSKCFLTLSEAHRKGLGGCPFGPAGTGKTETVKALGRVLGRFVAVFNCDESFDAVSVGRILAGACRIGSWVCFDEFNRLSASILSTTSGQLALLLAAIRNKVPVIDNFYGGDLPISIRGGVGVFVTMNPTYSGRRELPANLKSLFRPCAMSKPDSIAIAQVLLLSQGFSSSISLAQKLVSFFDGLKSSLRPKSHYDFGLRSLKSTVVAAGTLRKSIEENVEQHVLESHEENVVVQAIGEVLKPKLDLNDIEDYDIAISMVFSKATCFTSPLPNELETMLEKVFVDMGLIDDAVLLEKVRQLYALLRHQSGIMLVGPTGSGKTTVWMTLYEVMNRLMSKTRLNSNDRDHSKERSSLTVLDAKLLSMKQLYGFLDPISREWTDGLFTKTLRGISNSSFIDNENPFALHWIVFDGDIDPDWVENLNSVLDDNQMLTLPNGEQVPLPSNTRILFETEHLKHANPSTVSRCGLMCFGENGTLTRIFCSSMMSILERICPSLPQLEFLASLSKLSVQIISDVRESGKLIMQVPIQSILHSILVLLEHSMLRLKYPSNSTLKSDVGGRKSANVRDLSKQDFLCAFLVSVLKCIGSGLSYVDQGELSRTFVQRISALHEVQEILSGVAIPANLASVSVETNATFIDYADMVASFEEVISSDDIGSPDLVVATPTTTRLEAMLKDVLLLEGTTVPKIRPVVLCGPPGCGKSMILTAALRDIPNTSLATLSFSSQTTPESILATLRGHTVIARRPNGKLFMTPKAAGYRVVLFCDEVNLEKPDCYDSQKSVCLLRSLAERGGFWHGTPAEWIHIEGIQIVAACNPEEDAGRYKLPPRFLRHCMVIRVELPSSHDLKLIYGVFINSLLLNINPCLTPRTKSLTTAMVEFFEANKQKFSPDASGPAEPHYVYSPRELSRWIRGMKQLLVAAKEGSTFGSCVGYSSSTETLWNGVVAAFCYEGRRLFSDRLLLKSERMFMETKLTEITRRNLGPKSEPPSSTIFSSWLTNNDNGGREFQLVKDPQQFRTLIYEKLRVFAEEEGLGGSWMTGGSEANQDGSNEMIDQFAVTDDVLKHLTRIERILCQPLGHAVLMGAPGTGKKTLARFAAWMMSIEVHQIRSHSSYSEEDFATDLRQILKRAGVRGQQIMMIFDESNALDSGFLEMMNSILACGDIPGLFSGEDRSNLLDELRAASSQNISSSNAEQALYTEFVKRVRSNLHIVFTISTGCSGGDAFSQSGSGRSRVGGDIGKRSPALYNRCTVDWIGDWTKDTLEAVADLKLEVYLGEEKDQIVRSAVQIHEVAKRILRGVGGVVTDATPRHYLEFIEQLNRMALEKGNAIEAGVKRHTEGLRHLRKAGVAVDDVKDALNEKTANLQEKEKHANETLKTMVEEQRSAEKSKVGAEHLALAASEASLAVRDREEEVAAQLDAVQPKMEAAREAVGSIRKEYLEELRAMPNPPASVRVALEGVLMLLDATSSPRGSEMKVSWGSVRSRMRSSDFIASVVNFDAENLPRGVRSRIEKKILSNPDFDVQRIAYASRAAGPLAEWTLAILDYAAVKDAVEPLQKEVISLQEEQKELVQKNEEALHNVEMLEARIEKCRSEYASLVSEAERIRQEIQESEANLSRSENMLDSLANEWDRWVQELNTFNARAVTVWGNAVFGAAFVAYAGVLDQSNRVLLNQRWKDILKKEGIPFDADMEISDFLTSPEERGNWTKIGLPTDPTSLENYAILKRSARFPLIVDPTRSNSKLLPKLLVDGSPSKSKESTTGGNNTLRISKTSFTATGKKSYMRALESAMRFGTSILVEDADKFDRAIAPLLGQESSHGNGSEFSDSLGISSGGKTSQSSQDSRTNMCQRVVRLGDRDVFLNSRFRMYLATVDLKAVPITAITRSNIVSFELSPAALGTTCVSRAMKSVVPELEKRRTNSITAKLALEHRKQSLEDEVLSTINNVNDIGAEFLNGSLLDTLSTLKKEVQILHDRQAEEAVAAEEVSKVESVFEPLGVLAINLYGVIQRLARLNPIYSFNTEFFLRVFEFAIAAYHHEKPEESHGVDHVNGCRTNILKHVYLATAPSLFPNDRVPFAAAISVVSVDTDETNTFAAKNDDFGNLLSVLNDVLRDSTHDVNVQDFNKQDNLNDVLPRDVVERAQQLASSLSPDSNALSSFDTVLQLLGCLLYNPQRVSEAVDTLACTLPGNQELVHDNRVQSEVALRLHLSEFTETVVERNASASVQFSPVMVLSRGENVDPATLAADHCQKLGASLMSIAMGLERSEDSISEAISLAIRRSTSEEKIVLLLKNMHLASNQATERLHSEVMKRNGQLPFMLVVAAEVSSDFSKRLATGFGSLFKVIAFEAPPSFRANFSRGLNTVSTLDEMETRLSTSGAQLKKMQIIVSWLHACLLERALHHPIGFTKEYEFSESDLACAWEIVVDAVERLDEKEVREGVVDMLSTAVYGSRLEHSADCEVMRALLDDLFSPNRLISSEVKHVTMFKTQRGKSSVSIPLDYEQRKRFLSCMPLDAPSEWSYMPDGTNQIRRIAEGRTGVRKLFSLCKNKLQESSFSEEMPETKVETKYEGILAAGLELVSIDRQAAFENDSATPLKRYIRNERTILANVIETIKSDINLISLSLMKTLKECSRRAVLQEDLSQVSESGKRKIPSIWKEFSVQAGDGMCLEDFLLLLRHSATVFNNMRDSVNGSQDLAATLRPRALITALKYEAAMGLEQTPESLEPILTKLKNSSDGNKSVTGLVIEGAQWDSDRGIFVLAERRGCKSDVYSLRWCSRQNDSDYIRLPLYGRGSQRSVLIYVRIPVDASESLRRWRLRGVCFSVA